METELVRISLKNADDIFGEKYWKTVFEDIITYEVTNNKKSPDYISDVERDVYNEIWETLLSDNSLEEKGLNNKKFLEQKLDSERLLSQFQEIIDTI